MYYELAMVHMLERITGAHAQWLDSLVFQASRLRALSSSSGASCCLSER